MASRTFPTPGSSSIRSWPGSTVRSPTSSSRWPSDSQATCRRIGSIRVGPPTPHAHKPRCQPSATGSLGDRDADDRALSQPGATHRLSAAHTLGAKHSVARVKALKVGSSQRPPHTLPSLPATDDFEALRELRGEKLPAEFSRDRSRSDGTLPALQEVRAVVAARGRRHLAEYRRRQQANLDKKRA